MWAYEKKLQFPVKIKNPNPTYAKIIVSQLGGPDGEIGAAMRYLNQRYSMPSGEIIGILTDVGSEAAKKSPLGQAESRQTKICPQAFYFATASKALMTAWKRGSSRMGS